MAMGAFFVVGYAGAHTHTKREFKLRRSHHDTHTHKSTVQITAPAPKGAHTDPWFHVHTIHLSWMPVDRLVLELTVCQFRVLGAHEAKMDAAKIPNTTAKESTIGIS